MFDSPELDFALRAVRQATLLVQQVQTEGVSVSLTKGDRTPVTVADFAAQAIVGRLLAETFPDQPLVAEESASLFNSDAEQAMLGRVLHFVRQVLPEATSRELYHWIELGTKDPEAKFWTLDPLDGTKGFLRGNQFAVALALIEEGKVGLGVLGCPHLADGKSPIDEGPGSLVMAVRGQGTWTMPLDDETFSARLRLAVSDRGDPREARLLRSYEAGHTNTGQVGELSRVLDIQAESVGMDSQAKYALLAAGAGDVLVRLISARAPNYREKIWDQAAGSLVVEEAGGTVSDLQGEPLDFSVGRTLANNRGVLASNGHLHGQFLEALAKIGAAM